MSRRIIVIGLTMAIILGVVLRIAASRGWPLWQDEAETVINSLQVLERGYPHSTFKDKPLYESAVYIPSSPDDPKYAFVSTNYATSDLERNKGWLTYYIEAGFLKLFGFSTFTARLPFVLIAGATILMVFWLGRKLFNATTGLIAAALSSINYYAILNERQARYLSLEIFLVVVCLYFFYAAVTTGRRRDYLFGGVALALLFYTHLVSALALAVFFGAAHVYARHSLRALISKNFLLSVSVTLLLTVPWIVGVKLWTLTSAYTTVLGPLTGALIVLLVAVTYFFFQLFVPSIRLGQFRRLTSVSFLLLAAIVIVIVKPFVTPYESLAARLFVELNPIFMLLLAALGHHWWTSRNNAGRHLRAAAWLVPLLASIYIFNDGLGKFQNNLYDTRWVQRSIDFLDRHGVDEQTPVLVSYQQFPFMLYSDYNVDLLWPVRQSYINTYPGTLYFIINRQAIHPTMFYRRLNPSKEDLPYHDRIGTCIQHVIDEQTDILECP
ncbi:MAG: glycosyltransferase family 39 protein, partial [Candidatus Kerfeldbacteria bacterium]|nr:glycosyltransferase family 39 protein [Candidatus Kerfeldbacteria bacterium]